MLKAIQKLAIPILISLLIWSLGSNSGLAQISESESLSESTTSNRSVNSQNQDLPVGLTEVATRSAIANPFDTNPSKQNLEETEPPVPELSLANPYRLTGRFHLEQGTHQGYLVLECQLIEGSYIHSLTLPKELFPTVIQTQPSSQYRVGEQFHPDRPPSIVEKDPVFGERMEKHAGTTQFFVPIQLAPDVNPLTLEPKMAFNGQVCSTAGTCLPIRNQIVVAKFAGYFQRPAESDTQGRQAQTQQQPNR